MEPDSSPPPRRVRSGGVTVLCVLTLVLGALGGLAVLQTLASLALQSLGSSMPASAGPGVSPEMLEVQTQLEAATRAISRRFLPFIAVSTVLQLVLCTAFMFGGVQTLRLRPSGPTTLRRFFLAGLLIEPLRTLLGCWMIYVNFSTLQPFMGRMMAASSKGQPMPPGISQFMSQFMIVVGIATIVASVIWFVAKCTFFLWAKNYLNRPEVQAQFK